MSEQNETLSEREIEILRLVATGAANKEIARQLAISPNTVKVHLRNIFSKVGVLSRTEATLYAIQIGLVNTNAAELAPEEAEKSAGEAQDASTPVLLRNQSGNGASAGGAAIVLPDIRNEMAPRIRRIQGWQIGILVLLSMLLIGAGVVTAQLFLPQRTPAVNSPNPQPTIEPQHWTARAAIPSPRKGMGITEYNGGFYLVGGETTSGIDGAVMRYDPAANSWKTLSNKPTPVTDVQAALLGERIYIPGGRLANGQASDRLEVYNPRSDTWETRAPLPIPLSGYALASFEGRLYLFGGKSGSQYTAKVFEYDPQTDQWQERTPMSAPRAFASAVTTGENIHVIGGFDGKHALVLHEAYFPTRDANGEPAWQGLPPLPQGRYGMGAAHLAGVIFLLGGMAENNAAPAAPALQYMISSNQWGEFEAPPETVGGFPALLASGNFLYALGGETTNGTKPGILSAANRSYQAMYTNFVPLLSK